MGHFATVTSNLVGRNATQASDTLPIIPATPIHKNTSPKEDFDSQSSPIPHESDISQFLGYAETKLGVSKAMRLEPLMSANGFGPDILSDVPDERLEEIGVAKGDIIRMKRSATKWFYSLDRKRAIAAMKETHLSVPQPDPA